MPMSERKLQITQTEPVDPKSSSDDEKMLSNARCTCAKVPVVEEERCNKRCKQQAN